MKEFLKQVFWNNTIDKYLIVAGGFLLGWIVLRILKRYISWLKHTGERFTVKYREVAMQTIEKFLLPYLYILFNYTLITTLVIPAKFLKVLNVALAVVTTYYAVRLINYFIHKSVMLYMQLQGEPPERMRQLTGVLIVAKIVTWCVGILMLIDNLGYNVTTIIAGLGIGGIAIALAAQNILGDLFSYFVIFFDKPFEVGDFIIVNDKLGTVERIGIKTSHVRSLFGEQLVMPNAELVRSTIQNHKRLENRRISFRFNVAYDTDEEQLRNIPATIKEIVLKQGTVSFDRAHLALFGDWSLTFEVVYFVKSPDYNLFMDIQQSIMLEIINNFRKNNIKFSFPTRTLYVEGLKINSKE